MPTDWPMYRSKIEKIADHSLTGICYRSLCVTRPQFGSVAVRGNEPAPYAGTS
jgi:hypothetical protein